MKRSDQDGLNNYSSYIREINCYPVLNFKEEQKLAKCINSGDKEAREKLINSNLKLVIKIAMHYYKPEYDLMDLIQEGNIGLIIAVDKFDFRKKFRFSTYSSWWIKHFIMKSILQKEFHINLPIRKMKLLFRMEKTIYHLSGKLKRLPNIKELEQELMVESNKIKDVLGHLSSVLSLDSSIYPDSNVSLKDMICSRDYQPDQIVFNHSLLEHELMILDTLIKRDTEILKYRYGFYTGKKLTLNDVAKIYNITPEAVRLIELRALNKIRVNYKYLRDFLIF